MDVRPLFINQLDPSVAIRSFDDYQLYRPKFVGTEQGAFYQRRISNEAGLQPELFYIKTMLDSFIVNEYLASNIAHLLLEDCAPVVDLVLLCTGQKQTIYTASRVLPGFKNFEQLTEKVGLAPEVLLYGGVIEQDGRIQPRNRYSADELEADKELKIVPYIRGIEEVIIVAEFLDYLDITYQNMGAITKSDIMKAALVDFNFSLNYKNYRIEYDFKIIDDFNIDLFISAITNLISKEPEVFSLIDNLAQDIAFLNLTFNATVLKNHLKAKLEAFNAELMWLEAARILKEQLQPNADFGVLEEGLGNSHVLLVSNQTFAKVIDIAVKNEIILGLVDQSPVITSYKDYNVIIAIANIKYKSLANIQAWLSPVLEENIAQLLCAAIEYEKQEIIDYLMPSLLSIKDFRIVFECSVKFGDTKTFDAHFARFTERINPKSKMEQAYFLYKALDNAFIASVVSDRVELFNFIYPYIINKYFAPPNCDLAPKHAVVMALSESIKGNKDYFFSKLLPTCADGTLSTAVMLINIYNRKDFVEQANPQLLSLLHTYGLSSQQGWVFTTPYSEESDIYPLLDSLSHNLTIDVL